MHLLVKDLADILANTLAEYIALSKMASTNLSLFLQASQVGNYSSDRATSCYLLRKYSLGHYHPVVHPAC